jgi:formylglycine-generating enzyme required for sulfatase activity
MYEGGVIDSLEGGNVSMRSFPARILLASFLLSFLLSGPSHAAAERRTALVIGNASYSTGPLKNPVNDATDMAASLKKLGFTVILVKNAKLQGMEEAIEAFGKQLQKGGVGLFYYAGHGVRVKGVNYLIPVDARINKETDLKYKAVNANRVLDEMGYAKNPLNVVILDACRDNPFARSYRNAARGLAIVSAAPTGTFISYSTSPGNVARDGKGRNSPYTAALLDSMQQPGLSIEQVFKSVRVKLDKETKGKQVPWELSSLKGDFYFVPGSSAGKVVMAVPETADMKSPEDKRRQRKAEQANIPKRDTFTSPTLGAEFVLVPAGTFTMGGKGSDEEPHQVRISEPFFMQTTEVTQAQWRKVMGNNPAKFICNDCPVEQVSWEDIQEFIGKLNEMEETDKYRLPTEAQWEYAARSGGKQETYAGTSDASKFDSYAWYHDNSSNKTHPVGSKLPNGLGLYDMSGNVWEWVQDWFDTYPYGSVTDPVGPSAGMCRVYRGSAYNDWLVKREITSRNYGPPKLKLSWLGFRLVRAP